LNYFWTRIRSWTWKCIWDFKIAYIIKIKLISIVHPLHLMFIIACFFVKNYRTNKKYLVMKIQNLNKSSLSKAYFIMGIYTQLRNEGGGVLKHCSENQKVSPYSHCTTIINDIFIYKYWSKEMKWKKISLR
jgi:hypothetical protein